MIPDKVSSEMKLHVREGELNPVINRSSSNRISGVELLDKKKGVNIEDTKILTDEDFKKIKKLQN